uniref:Extended synaptotagmin 2 n=1 Tax=Takifugu rubripes TaxID=31033 RepID=A0A674MJP7_TAKRU
MEGPGVGTNGPLPAPRNSVSSTTGPPLPPDQLHEEPQSSLTDLIHMWIKFGKTFAIIFPIYVLGYLEFSFSWVLVGLAMLFYWRKNHGNKDYRINRALAFLEHEEKAVKQSVPTTDLPPWVHYPDVERTEWLNKTVKQMWPFICQFVDKLFRETIEPAVKGANPHLSSFCFTKIDMGQKPLRVNGVKVYTENVDKRQIIMDLQISFVGNTEIDVDIKKYYCRAGIKSIQLHGTLRVVMEPLLGDMPLVGALSVFFLKKPLLDINWTGLTNVLDIPGVNGLCDNIIQDIICTYLVLPNRISIPLVGESQLAQLRFPVPKVTGLRIHSLEAQDLLGKDKFLGGLIKGKSDPYGVLRFGTELFQSKVIHETVNPKWTEVYEALIYENTGKNLEIELFDEDTDKDDFLGCLMIDLAQIQQQQKIDEWFSLEDVPQGKLHLRLDWLTPLATPDKLDQALISIKAEPHKANDGLSAALLVVFLDSARNLPVSRVTSDPSPFVQFRVGHKSFESKGETIYKTNEPVWEETHTFLIHKPPKPKSWRSRSTIARWETLTLPLTRLLEAEDMTLNQRFPLKNSGPSCTLKMKDCPAGRTNVLYFDTDSSPSSEVPSSPLKTQNSSNPTPRPSVSSDPHRLPEVSGAPSVSPQDLQARQRDTEDPFMSSGSAERSVGNLGDNLADIGRSTGNLASSGSQQYQPGGKEPTPSIASDISNPYAAQELQQRLQQLQNGSGPGYFPLGQIQLTVRHSSQRNKLIVVVHSCRNLIAFTDHGSDPYVRLYLLPDKRRSGRRKTHTLKRNLNPVYDQTFEFTVSLVELHRRTLDVAVKNGGSLLSKHKGLLGKVLVDLTHEDISKGFTQWLVFLTSTSTPLTHSEQHSTFFTLFS